MGSYVNPHHVSSPLAVAVKADLYSISPGGCSNAISSKRTMTWPSRPMTYQPSPPIRHTLVAKMFPQAALLWLELHPFSQNDIGARMGCKLLPLIPLALHVLKCPSGSKGLVPPDTITEQKPDSPLVPPLFHPARVRQHASILRHGARAAGIDSLDVSFLRLLAARLPVSLCPVVLGSRRLL